MEESVENEDELAMAIVAHEVGFETIESIVEYYNKMLMLSIIILAKELEMPPIRVREMLEEQLDLKGAFEGYIGTLQASVEYNQSLFPTED
jgi:hypothetical protein